jgi:hypothetical protein
VTAMRFPAVACLSLLAALWGAISADEAGPPAGKAETASGAGAHSRARLRPVPWRHVEITGGFWKAIRDRSRDLGVPDYLAKFEMHGYIDNLRFVAEGRKDEAHRGGPNNDEFVHEHFEAMGCYAGEKYFRSNPLRFDPRTPRRPGRRSGWFGCSCCPPNVHRLLAALPQYMYTSDARGIQVNLFVDSTIRHTLPGGGTVRLVQTTRYPWEGIVRVARSRASGRTAALSHSATRARPSASHRWKNDTVRALNEGVRRRPLLVGRATDRRPLPRAAVLAVALPDGQRVEARAGCQRLHHRDGPLQWSDV